MTAIVRTLTVLSWAFLTVQAEGQELDTSRAFGGLRDAAATCRRDGGALWGRPLCGPVMLVDPQTRLAILNDTVPQRTFVRQGELFLSTLPSDQPLANTSVSWAGRQWAMILLPLPDDRFDRTTLILHESFHREQGALGLNGGDPPNNQLDQRAGRRWLRLELHALAAALNAFERDSSMARQYARDALLFRAQRRALYPSADSLESALEMQEGLAEYTGERLALAQSGATLARVAKGLLDFQKTTTYVRSFAYATGPGYGFLLDAFRPEWHREITRSRSLSDLLAKGVGFTNPRRMSEAAEHAARSYPVAVIDAEEGARDSERNAAMARYRARLVIGPTLVLSQLSLGRNFNPSTLVGYDAANTVYPTGSFRAEWGALEVTGGALVSNDFRHLTIEAPGRAPAADARTISGPGWELTLKAGWTVNESATRPGSYVVQATPR